MNRAERRRQARKDTSRAATAQAAARGRLLRWLPPVIVVVMGIASFASGLDGAFVLDDVGHIVDTTHIRDLASSFSGRRPVVQFTLGVNYALGGLETSGYHAFNIAVHLLAGLALLGIVRRTLARIETPPHIAPAAPWLALAIALLWVVHPLQTQSVTYVIQRSESMMGLFYLLTLYAFLRGATAERGAAWFAASVAACALGMGSKEVMVTAPVMVLLYDATFVAGSFRSALRQRWAVHAALAATWGVLIATGILGIFDPGSGRNAGFGYEGVTWLEYGRTQPEIILHYIRLAVWPSSLCLDYLWPVQESWGRFAAGAAILGALAGATALFVMRGRAWGYVGAWFFVILAPTSSFVPVRDLAFEHRMYLPLAALLVVGVLAGDALVRGVSRRRGVTDGARRAVAAAILGVVAASFATRTAIRNRDYASSVRMWQSVVEARPMNDRAQQNLGSAMLAQGRFEEAVAASRRAIEINPANGNAHVNLGTLAMQRGAAAEALAHYETAVRVEPTNAIAHNNLASLHAQRGNMGRAYDLYAEAVRIEPAYVQARFSLGRILERRGDRAGALREYRALLAIDPSHARARERVAALTN